jgi:TIGR03009 family protein
MPPIRMISLIMRAPFRFVAVPCGLLVLSAFVASLSAQQPTVKTIPRSSQLQPAPAKSGQAPKAGPLIQTGGQYNIGPKSDPAKPPRPAGDDLIVPRISPELREILDDWEQHSSQIKSLHGKHTRFVYNHVFEIEKRSDGKWYLETPDKGRIDLVGIPPKKNEISKKIGKKSGKPYRIEADEEQMWICNGNDIVVVDSDQKTYEVTPVPEHLRGTNIVNGPLPFLFGLKAADAEKRYELTLLANGKTSVRIQIVPRLQSDKDNYRKAVIILDKSRYLPTAVQLEDPTGNLETVYLFEILDVNNRSLAFKIKEIFSGDSDPFDPDLKKKGYKRVLPAPVEIAAPRSNGKEGRAANTEPAPRAASNPGGVPRR